MTDTPNFEARITALVDAFERELSPFVDVTSGPAYVREACFSAITRVKFAAAIARDYARRAEGE
jgi:hypothetical protein